LFSQSWSRYTTDQNPPWSLTILHPMLNYYDWYYRLLWLFCFVPLLIEHIHSIPRMDFNNYHRWPRNRSSLLLAAICQLFGETECSIHFTWPHLFAKYCNLILERLLEMTIVPLTYVVFFNEMEASKNRSFGYSDKEI
jgi:hypothetical protein